MSLKGRHLATNSLPALCSFRSPFTDKSLSQSRSSSSSSSSRRRWQTLVNLAYALWTVKCLWCNISSVKSFVYIFTGTEVEESTPPVACTQLHLLYLVLRCTHLQPCIHLHLRLTLLHTVLVLALFLLLLWVTSPSLFIPLDQQFSTPPGFPLVPSPL